MVAMLNEWLWQEQYWLPPGIRWQDIEMKDEDGRFPMPRDLLITLPLAFAFIALRYVFERIIAIPFSKCLGVKDRFRIRAPPIPKLEAFYEHSQVVSLGRQCGLSQRKIQTWFRHRRNQDKPITRFLFLDSISEITSLASGPVADAHYWYYILELSFYLSLLLSVSVDVKRKDFKEQVVHHIATIFLIGFSYAANYVRVGTLVMLVHDSSDFLLESAKMFHYAVWTTTCDSLFVVFAVVFLVTRLVVFPCRIVHTTMVLSRDFFQPFFGYYFFNVLLLVLQGLHIFWAYLILRMLYKFVFTGKVTSGIVSGFEASTQRADSSGSTLFSG
uniref:Ceramide synthase 4a n=1 Tax=Poecilia reticulata TaxID=8081 RepID=A0A3P9PS65_POERE